MNYNGISVIVPTFNEEGSIKDLVHRIHSTLNQDEILHEIIVIDDNSTDKTWDYLEKLKDKYPLIIQKKHGTKGKAFSLLQGFRLARLDLVAMIDADLQYPPEAISEMIDILNEKVDVVVADRKYENVSTARKILHFGFKYFFGKILHGLNHDVQSGLKVFKKEILSKIELYPTQWTFDLEFLLKAKNIGYEISDHKIVFSERIEGESKIKTIEAIKEIGLSALKIKFNPWDTFPSKSRYSNLLVGNKGGRVGDKPFTHGFFYKGKEYSPHSQLHLKESALFSLTTKQKIEIILVIFLLFAALLLNWHLTIVTIISFISFIYFADLIHNFYLIYKSAKTKPEIDINSEEIMKGDRTAWPKYTIFCPLYKESQVLPQFIDGIKRLDYPKDKLQVLLLLEEDDTETIETTNYLDLPSYVDTIVVPESIPKTKPKACNYGLQFADGNFSVIYDAEDIPDTLQLKKAVIAFEKLGEKTQCVQAKLNFYNPRQNILTRLFTGEYTLWFDLILTGLQAVEAPIPLGGTSNHFRTNYLLRLNGWDAFNVTEDCDLGMRLAKQGNRTAIMNSTTMEEANSNLKNWFNQRTRWVKGYIQTYFVHMRDVKKFIRQNGFIDFIYFQLVVGGKVFSMLVNPLMWSLFIMYFVLRASFGEFIESFFPPPIFYIATFSLVVGNFIYFYHYMIAVVMRGKYDLVKYSYLVPFYWLFMSAAAWIAVYRLIREPHYWSKTEHGLHLEHESVRLVSDLSPAYQTADFL